MFHLSPPRQKTPYVSTMSRPPRSCKRPCVNWKLRKFNWRQGEPPGSNPVGWLVGSDFWSYAIFLPSKSPTMATEFYDV